MRPSLIVVVVKLVAPALFDVLIEGVLVVVDVVRLVVDVVHIIVRVVVADVTEVGKVDVVGDVAVVVVVVTNKPSHPRKSPRNDG